MELINQILSIPCNILVYEMTILILVFIDDIFLINSKLRLALVAFFYGATTLSIMTFSIITISTIVIKSDKSIRTPSIRQRKHLYAECHLCSVSFTSPFC